MKEDDKQLLSNFNAGQYEKTILFAEDDDFNYQMPVMDGFEAIEQIRKKIKSVPIVAHTAVVYDNFKEKAFDLGCNEFVAKPVKPEVLIPVIEKHIS